jgi:S1-C subfamily serine protease
VIPQTLPATQAATYLLSVPDPDRKGLCSAAGTGFFVSADGHLLTSRHVITTNGKHDGPLRPQLHLMHPAKEIRIGGTMLTKVGKVDLLYEDPTADIALFKIDAEFAVLKADSSTERISPPYISVSSRLLPEGESVYTFGYPLSTTLFSEDTDLGTAAGQAVFCPRVTSAVIASIVIATATPIDPNQQPDYLLDRAAASGNSGGPVVRSETGAVHGLIRSCLPVFEGQPDLEKKLGYPVSICIPSVTRVTRLSHAAVLSALTKYGVPIIRD